MKEWYFINVTNVVTDHLKSQILNFYKHMQERVHKYAKKSHKCNNCSFSTSLGVNLRIHMRRHNSEKHFKCDQCSYEGNQKVILKMHCEELVRSVHNDLWFRCQDSKQVKKSNLKTHIQIHHERMVYITDVTNVVTEHLKSKTLKNTCRNMYLKMGKIN